MNYIELKLTIVPNTEVNRDIMSSLLADIGFESFMEFENGLDAYIPETLFAEENLEAILKNLPLSGVSVQYQAKLVQGKDWNEEWEKHFFQPIIIKDQVVIHSSFHKDIPPLPYPIVIDPKMAFGTGHHATTALMIDYLLEQDVTDKSFLDMGCGTAVLAILAKMRDAHPVCAVDNDEWASENSSENVFLNNVSGIEVKLGDANLLGKDIYDFIFANINRNILLKDIPVYAACMSSGASLFLSGFYMEDRAVITEQCEMHQLKLISYKEKDNWVAMHFTKLS